MANYLIGDIQGCDQALARLLSHIGFSASRDTLYVLGDLVNRGPHSSAVLRRLMRLEGAARCVLGNHDLHLLAVAYGVRAQRKDDTLAELLQSSDSAALVQWLRHQPLALFEHHCLMVHAGVLPDWSVNKTLRLAAEVEVALRASDFRDFLRDMYGSQPTRWHKTLMGADRTRVIVNALTRMRFCSLNGEMEFSAKEGAQAAPAGFMPWFDVPTRKTAQVSVAFGHWSTLGLVQREKLLSLDTGCVWGGCLSAVPLDAQGRFGKVLQVKCEQAQRPGNDTK
jgi:bis(5'-nucleosyl)-tetraphosphatase (symmetrical)